MSNFLLTHSRGTMTDKILHCDPIQVGDQDTQIAISLNSRNAATRFYVNEDGRTKGRFSAKKAIAYAQALRAAAKSIERSYGAHLEESALLGFIHNQELELPDLQTKCITFEFKNNSDLTLKTKAHLAHTAEGGGIAVLKVLHN
jgi:hypothetical protein